MEVIKEYKIGSSCFFAGIDGYEAKDNDTLCICDEFPSAIKRTNVLNLKDGKDDVFFFRNMDKEGFIKDTLECKVPMRVGKFLIPEFCESIGFEVNDLKIFDKIFNELDEKHRYEKLIYQAYIKNGKFKLTDEQRLAAYEEYKRWRQ